MTTLRCRVRARAAGGVDFAAFGENSLDTVVVGAPGWEPGAKRPAARIADLPGGQAATAAVACARLGWRTRYLGAMGDDEAGARLRAALVEAGVEPVIVTRSGVPTRRAVVLVDERSGERMVFERRDPALNIGPDELPASAVVGARVLLVDGTDLPQALRVARLARSSGTRTIVDLDRPRPGAAELLRLIDVVVLPRETVAELEGEGDPAEAAGRLARSTGAAAVVVTLGADGAVGWCDGRVVRVPAAPVPVVDTTGAGDAFRAGFAAGWLAAAGTDPDFEALLEGASLVAGLNCRDAGAQAALPAKHEVPERLRGPV